jgi:SLOG in TRPM
MHLPFVPDAWIITGGTKAGVMEIVGETILDYMLQTGGTEKRITALGIASWGFVANKDVLVSPDVSRRSITNGRSIEHFHVRK